MRIKQIKINGIRGFIYRANNPHLIDLNYKHLFLYGKNGTGKSSFFDAFKWVLTGNIEEAKVRRVEREDLLRNKFCKVEDIPFVEIIYKDESNEEKSFKRHLSSKNGLEREDIISDNFIDAKRIENFVIDTKKSLWNRFADLLGFEDLILFEKRLIRLKNEAEKKFKEANRIFEDEKTRFENLKVEKKKLEKKSEKEMGKDWKDLLRSHKERSAKFNDFENLKNVIVDYLQAVESEKKLNTILVKTEEEFKEVTFPG